MSEQHKKPPHPFTLAFDPEAFEAGLRGLARRAPFEFPRTAVPTHFKHSSVLICFWRGAAGLHVLLTKRAASLRGHPGQMSFPGGRLEEGETWTEAALRETEEEVGLSRDRVEVLGRLDDAWSGAGHLIVPIVGWLDRPCLGKRRRSTAYRRTCSSKRSNMLSDSKLPTALDDYKTSSPTWTKEGGSQKARELRPEIPRQSGLEGPTTRPGHLGPSRPKDEALLRIQNGVGSGSGIRAGLAV